MKRATILIVFLFCFTARSDEGKALNFQEVFQLIRTNISDLSESELSHSAAMGLIKEMGTRVQIVTTNGEAATLPPDAISKRAVFEDRFGYIRVKSVDERLPSEFQKSLRQLIDSNELRGIVVDLRYAGGTNYQAAAKVADSFIKGGQKLLKLGASEIESTEENETVRLPAVALVNGETRAGAEAIAAILRESAGSLVIGKKTAGEARLFELFTLSSGQKVRVGKVPIQVASGEAIPASGLEPDITVPVRAEDEKVFYLDPYRERSPFFAGTNTNEVASATTPIRARPLNEAELVRQHRNGFDFSEEEPPSQPKTPVITDPTLSRALDILKGIAILQPRRSP